MRRTMSLSTLAFTAASAVAGPSRLIVPGADLEAPPPSTPAWAFAVGIASLGAALLILFLVLADRRAREDPRDAAFTALARHMGFRQRDRRALRALALEAAGPPPVVFLLSPSLLREALNRVPPDHDAARAARRLGIDPPAATHARA